MSKKQSFKLTARSIRRAVSEYEILTERALDTIYKIDQAGDPAKEQLLSKELAHLKAQASSIEMLIKCELESAAKQHKELLG